MVSFLMIRVAGWLPLGVITRLLLKANSVMALTGVGGEVKPGASSMDGVKLKGKIAGDRGGHPSPLPFSCQDLEESLAGPRGPGWNSILDLAPGCDVS